MSVHNRLIFVQSIGGDQGFHNLFAKLFCDEHVPSAKSVPELGQYMHFAEVIRAAFGGELLRTYGYCGTKMVWENCRRVWSIAVSQGSSESIRNRSGSRMRTRCQNM